MGSQPQIPTAIPAHLASENPDPLGGPSGAADRGGGQRTRDPTAAGALHGAIITAAGRQDVHARAADAAILTDQVSTT
jgi:hypothetical protein